MPRLKQKHRKAAESGAFGALTGLEDRGATETRVYARTSDTYTLEEERRRQWMVDREALAEWRLREDNADDDEYVAQRDTCYECGSETWMETTMHGTLTELCPTCGVLEVGWRPLGPRIVRGAFDTQGLMRRRLRHFDTRNIRGAPGPQRKSGVVVEYVPATLPADSLTASLLETLSRFNSIDALPSGAAAVEFIEATRWTGSPSCVRCGDPRVGMMTGRDGRRNARYLWRCRSCKSQFTVKVGTIMEDSPIPCDSWLRALWAVAVEKNRVSYPRIARLAGVSEKSGFLLLKRVRLALCCPQAMSSVFASPPTNQESPR